MLPTTSDTATREFRKWWTKVGLSSTPPNTFGPASPESLKAMPRAAQLNRFENHAATCSACRKVTQRTTPPVSLPAHLPTRPPAHPPTYPHPPTKQALAKFKRIRDVVPWAALALVGLRLRPIYTLPGLLVLLWVRKVCEGIVNELGGPEPSALEPRSAAASKE